MSIDLMELAKRLEREEALKLKYRCPFRTRNGKGVRYEERVGQLLDVELDTDKLFVRCNSQVIWIKAEEVLSLIDDKR